MRVCRPTWAVMEEAFEQVEMMPEREFCKASHYNVYAHMKQVFDFGTKSRKKGTFTALSLFLPDHKDDDLNMISSYTFVRPYTH